MRIVEMSRRVEGLSGGPVQVTYGGQRHVAIQVNEKDGLWRWYNIDELGWSRGCHGHSLLATTYEDLIELARSNDAEFLDEVPDEEGGDYTIIDQEGHRMSEDDFFCRITYFVKTCFGCYFLVVEGTDAIHVLYFNDFSKTINGFKPGCVMTGSTMREAFDKLLSQSGNRPLIVALPETTMEVTVCVKRCFDGTLDRRLKQ